MWWVRLVTWARAGAALWVALIAVLAGLQNIDVIPDAPKVEAWVWIISLTIIAVDNVGTLISRRVHGRRTVRDDGLTKAGMALLIAIARNNPTVRFEELGVSVYTQTQWSRMKRQTGKKAQLKRTHKWRPPGAPQQSGIKWTGEKGTVGECWRGSKTAYKNTHAITKKWGNRPLDEQTFETKVSKEAKHGFTMREFESIAPKYSEVLSEPVWDERREQRQIGVLTIDRAYNAHDDPFMPALDARGTRELAAASASVVGNILKPKGSE